MAQDPLFEYKPKPHHPPVDFIREGAERYQAERGKTYTAPRPDLQNDPVRGALRARAYTQAPNLDSPAAQSYDAFRRDLSSQWNHLTGHGPAGLGVKVDVTPHDPYANPNEMRDDLAQNRRMKVFSTAATGHHPVLSDEENDQFRAVHDAFGHAAIGSSFSRNGEEQAYESHAQMFSPEALPALRSETRGQNSVLIQSGQFPEQKATAIPSDRELVKQQRMRNRG